MDRLAILTAAQAALDRHDTTRGALIAARDAAIVDALTEHTYADLQKCTGLSPATISAAVKRDRARREVPDL